MLFLSLVLLIHSINACSWPTADVLFIIDGTLSVNVYEHLSEVDFIRKSFEFMGSNSVAIAVSQFTPLNKLVFGLEEFSGLQVFENRLQTISYSPCDPLSRFSNCSPSATLNSIAKQALLPGNRKTVPDVIVVIGSSKFSLPNIGEKEVLFSPISPLHTFQISIGGETPQNDKFEGAATLIRMHAIDFPSLVKLVDPLCQSVDSFVGHSNSSVFGPLCWLITVILGLLFLILLCIAGYIIYYYRQEVLSCRRRLEESERAIRSQNEYFTSKLHSQMEEQIATSHKHADDLRKQQETLQTQQLELQRQWQQSTTSSKPSQPIIIPYYPPKSDDEGEEIKVKNRKTRDTSPPDSIHFTFDGKEVQVRNGRVYTRFLNERQKDGKELLAKSSETTDREIPKEDELKNQTKREVEDTAKLDANHPNENSHKRKDEKDGSRDKDDGRQTSQDTSSTDVDSESVDSSAPVNVGSLPANHPARSLPPIDILFLVDSSSSIGITNFDAMKENMVRLLDNIDIAPGRSRACVIQYAQEPSVVFGFDKYYSIGSVKKGIQRMSYTGGSTMLAKALSFAAGVLYNEQNMKNSKKKHKFMPTPRHDRLQILCLVSDGASDDNIEKAANYIHERLQVKVLGMVSKSFNRDKLLPVTRFEGSVFVMSQTESMSLWIWRQQKLWADNYSRFFEEQQQQ